MGPEKLIVPRKDQYPRRKRYNVLSLWHPFGLSYVTEEILKYFKCYVDVFLQRFAAQTSERKPRVDDFKSKYPDAYTDADNFFRLVLGIEDDESFVRAKHALEQLKRNNDKFLIRCLTHGMNKNLKFILLDQNYTRYKRGSEPFQIRAFTDAFLDYVFLIKGDTSARFLDFYSADPEVGKATSPIGQGVRVTRYTQAGIQSSRRGCIAQYVFLPDKAERERKSAQQRLIAKLNFVPSTQVLNKVIGRVVMYSMYLLSKYNEAVDQAVKKGVNPDDLPELRAIQSKQKLINQFLTQLSSKIADCEKCLVVERRLEDQSFITDIARHRVSSVYSLFGAPSAGAVFVRDLKQILSRAQKN